MAAARGARVLMRVGTDARKGNNIYKLLERFREIADVTMRDVLEVTVLSGEAPSMAGVHQQVARGRIEAAGIGAEMPELEPVFSLFDLPFLWADRTHVYRALDGAIGEELNQALLKRAGVRLLGCGELGFRHLTNAVRPVSTPVDLKGLRIRVPSVELRIAALEAMGATALPLPFYDMYPALQRGDLDGQENPANTIVELALWEVQRFVSLTNHIFSPAYLVINERFFQSLPPDIRRGVVETAAAARGWQRTESQRNESRELEQARAHGMNVNEAEVDSFLPGVRRVWNRFSSTTNRRLVEQALSLRSVTT